MSLTMRPMRDADDPERMIDLVHATPNAHRHVIDLPYRLCSDSMQVPENVRLWEDDDALVAWAAWQQPFVTLDLACQGDAEEALWEAMIAWAGARFAQIARETGRTLDYFVDAREDDLPWRAFLERHGFRPDPGWQLLHLTRALHTTPAKPNIAAGYTIRPLAGETEIAAYVDLHRAAFGTTNMTAQWRARILRMPQYAPTTDLVAAAPDGAIAAFCICWLHIGTSGIEGQIEPLGVHPAHQGHGLGRAILLEGLRRLHAHGARMAHIEVEAANGAARHLYEHDGGFQRHYTALKYMREF